MVWRMAVRGVVLLALLILGTFPAWCQGKGKSLPDAPSVRIADQAGSSVLAGKAYGPLLLSSRFLSASPSVGPAPRANPFLGKTIPEKGADALFTKYLSASPQRQISVNNASDSDGLMGRAVHAASRTFFTRDDSGKSRLNTSYFLRALTYVAADTASRPYWRRSSTGPISDFGSTVGNDAGMNLFHEFRPGIEQLMKSHAPKFVSRIEERIEQK
jgi:hypothetical protein